MGIHSRNIQEDFFLLQYFKRYMKKFPKLFWESAAQLFKEFKISVFYSKSIQRYWEKFAAELFKECGAQLFKEFKISSLFILKESKDI